MKDGSLIQREYAPKIAKLIEKAAGYGGQTLYRVFEDWVTLSRITAEAMPRHIKSRLQGKELTPDKPEEQEIWKRIMSRHKESVHPLFSEAFAYLLMATAEGYTDVLGHTFETMELAGRNNKSGLFFTPWNVSYFMAQIINPGADCHTRVKEALLHPDNPAGQALLLAGGLTGQALDLSSEWAEEFFMTKLLPAAIPFIKPVTVLEPCCGSGGMIIAAAAVSPRWAIDSGVLQFWGMDINPLCIEMCKTNVALYGINGAYIRNGLDLSEEELEQIPEPYRTGTQLVKEAKKNGNNKRAEEIEFRLRADQTEFDPSKYTQSKMFEEV